MQPPAAEDEQHTGGEERQVPGQRRAEVVPHVVDAEEMVVDDALDEVEGPPPREHQTEVEAPVGRQPPFPPGDDVATEPPSTRNQVATWKKPSASVFTSSPATVVTG